MQAILENLERGFKMARLSTILGGTPGKPGERGIAPQPPKPPQPPQIPKIPKIPKASSPVERKKTDAHGDRPSDDQNRDHEVGHT